MTTSTSASTSKSTLATLTVLGRLRDTPHLWVFVTVCALLVALATLQLSSVRKDLNSAQVGFDIQRRSGALIGTHDSRWQGVETGDELVSLNHIEITSENFFDVRTSVTVGQPVTLQLERDGVPFEVTAEATPISVISALAFIMRWLTGVLLYMLGAGIFLLRPGAKLSRLFFIFLSEVGSLVLIMQGFPVPIGVTFAFIGALFLTAPVVGFHFFALFPTELSVSRFARYLYALNFVAFAVNIGLQFKFGGASVASTSLIRFFSVVSGLPVFATVTYQFIRARRLKDPRLASVTKSLLIATVGGLMIPLLSNTAVRALGIEGGIAHQITAIAVLFFAVTTAMTLVRHNPLEIDRYAASVVGYVVTLGGLGGVFVLMLFTLPLVLKRLGVANNSELLVGLTALTFISVGPVYRRMRKAVDKWFSREQADALKTSEVLRRIGDAVQNESRERSLSHIVDAALVIGADQAALWQIDASGRSLHRVVFKNGKPEMPFVAREGPIERALEKPCGVSGLGPPRLPTETQQAVWELGIAMSAPVRAHGVPVGFLGVGRRSSGFGYRDEDLSFLETLASQAGLAMERGEVITQIGRYRVEKRLAQGGMAEVFVAWQLGPGGFERKVALKRLLPELAEDPTSAAGLLDEARITARLQHQNIAQVYEVGLEAGQHFIAMEFVDGPPLRALVSNQKRGGSPTPLPIALSVAQGLLSALDHAHQLHDAGGAHLHVVHRDVTPANVLVSNRGETKLVDFGLVMASTRLFKTQTGVARGTVPFMSPEQAIHDDAIDLRSDVYSAGATLYELFTNERAFPEGPNGSKPLPISRANPLLPDALDAVFTRATAVRADERFATAGAFWEAIRAATMPTPVAPPAEVASWVALNRAQPEPKVKALEGTRSLAVPTDSNAK